MSIRSFWRRVCSGSFRRFFHNLEQVRRETGKNRIRLFFDMANCMLFHGVGYLDYVIFGFALIGKEKRGTFIRMEENIAYCRRLNQREAYPVFQDKLIFNKTFAEFRKTPFIDLREGRETFREFCRGRQAIFAKVTGSFGGQGVERIALEGKDLDALYDALMEKQMFLAEEEIRQHPEMAKLCPSSVNTLRITTIVNDRGTPHALYALVRVGSGKTAVDNVTSGGMYTLLSPEGRIEFPLFCDKAVEYYEKHPLTGQPFLGFQIPYFREAVELCLRAALVEPRMRYIGWDAAITPEGPVLIEGNHLPGYDMCQNHRFHTDGCGMKAAFEEAIR